jgi:MFS family permease
MGVGVAARARGATHALHEVALNGDLRRLQIATFGSTVVNWMSGVTLAIIAFRAGGPASVGVLAAVQLAPAIAMTPIAGVVADRYLQVETMVVSALARALIFAGISLAALDHAPLGVIIALAGSAAAVGCFFRPAQMALVPVLAQSPEELTANNVVSGTSEAVGSVGGPAIGGLLLIVATPAVVLLVVSLLAAASAVLLLRMSSGRWARTAVLRPESRDLADDSRHAVLRLGSEFIAGFHAVVTAPRLRLLTGLCAAQALIAGAVSVLVVSLALSLLRLGRPGVGYLESALAAGGIVGVLASFALVRKRRLGATIGIGLLLWGPPIVLIGVAPTVLLSGIMLAAVGLGSTLVNVAAVTLIQRTVDGRLLARSYGAVVGLMRGAMALGAGLVPALILTLGMRSTLMVTGVLLPVVVVLVFPRLRALDRIAVSPPRGLELLRSLPLFASLPEPVLEALALHLGEVRVTPGQVILSYGEPGDLYYLIDSGEVSVTQDNHELRRLTAGAGFGEIALLREVPRTATVTAVSECVLLTLSRDPFIAAVTGYPKSSAVADALVASRLEAAIPAWGMN